MATLSQLKELTDRLDAASIQYYNGQESEYSDTEFDIEMHRLQNMESELGFIYPNSPTQRVGSDIQDKFGKISHPSPMLTIENVYSDEEFKEWIDNIENTYGVNVFNCSVKYDGVSCELHYVNGVFKSAATRGDKNIGDDITENVKTIRNIPFVLHQLRHTNDVYVRGEILMRKSVLARLNEEREAKGERLFVNTRNACSGSVKQLDPKITASRNLIFKAWDIIGEGFESNTMLQKYCVLRDIGFYYEDGTFPFSIGMLPASDKSEYIASSVNSFYSNLKKLNLDYDFDGVVVKIDSTDIQNKIGTKDTRAIEWGIARKWNEDYATKTTIVGIDWQVGRTGIVTPVARLLPVECSGVVVRNATLHNVEVVRKNDIHIGNDVDIVRSGGVIPDVTKIYHDILMEMNGAHEAVEIPDICPVCGKPLKQEGKFLMCVNDNCPAIRKGVLLQFCSKDSCDIKSIGESVIDDLYKKNIIRDIRDIIKLASYWSRCEEKSTDVVFLSIVLKLGKGYGEKSVKKILDGMLDAMHTDVDRVLCGLSIPGVGKVTARNIMNHFGNLETLKNADVSEIASIDGIGNVVSVEIKKWIENNGDIFDLMKNSGWKCEISKPSENTATDKLNGMVVCFTGKSYRFSGDDVEKFLEANGAKCTHSVSKTTSYLITGEKPGGSKVDKAKSYGVNIITERDFYYIFSL